MLTFQSSLLRRTAAVALAAVAGLFISAGSRAAVVTLSGASGSSCSYSSMSVAPDGSFTVICAATTAGSPGALLLGAQADVALGTAVTMNAFRSGGSTGAVGAQYNVNGTGCAATGGTLSWADGDVGGKPISVTTTAAGSCTVALGGPTGGASLGSPASVTFNVTSGATTPPPTPSNCPTGFTAPSNMLTASFKPIGAVLLQMQGSGQVVSMTLPDVQNGYHSGQLVFSESAGGAYTPQPVTLNISISKCAGLIDTDTTSSCNLVNTNGNYNSLTWFSSAYSVIQDPPSANRYSFCWAPKSEGPWYVNARWTYSSCAFGAQVCGFAIQQNYGSW